MILKFWEDIARDCVYEPVRRTCNLIISLIQAWSIGLLKEKLNYFLIKSSSGPEVIPSSAPTLLLCGRNVFLIQAGKLKFVYVFWYEFKLLYISFLLPAEPISPRPVLWKVDHRQFSILECCLCSSPKRISFSPVIYRVPKVSSSCIFLTAEKGKG